ncbi:coronamic acid biosynthesis protein CmaL [soil metagenome]|jgi:uncharacterized protein (DUF1330 family)
MPKGYIMCEIDVTDPDLYAKEYIPRSTPAVAEHGGRFLVRGGNPVVLEGEGSAKRVVVVEFESVAKAREFYESAAYQEASKWRRRGATTTSYMLLEGAD